jgi:hypothetical protein
LAFVERLEPSPAMFEEWTKVSSAPGREMKPASALKNVPALRHCSRFVLRRVNEFDARSCD